MESKIIEDLCDEIYTLAKQGDVAEVHRLNIRLVRLRAKPEHRARAERTVENLQAQIDMRR